MIYSPYPRLPPTPTPPSHHRHTRHTPPPPTRALLKKTIKSKRALLKSPAVIAQEGRDYLAAMAAAANYAWVNRSSMTFLVCPKPETQNSLQLEE